jgi:hypothetical protein
MQLVLTLTFLVALAYGWALNLLAVVGLEPFVWTAKTVIAIGGIFVPPVGIIMGYFVW